MNRSIFALLPLMGVAMLALPAVAADSREGPDYWQNVTVLNLNGEAHRTVTADKLTANLAIEYEADSAAAVQAWINEKMKAAKDMADDVSGVKFVTGSYNVYQPYQNGAPVPGGKKASTWHARQDVTLSGGTADSLTKLTARLQKAGFAMNNFSYELSRELADKVRGDLTNEALDDVKAKAQKIADHLGMKSIRYATISFGGGGVVQPMYARAMMAKGGDAAESMPDPVATAGTVDVNVSVSAEVHLR